MDDLLFAPSRARQPTRYGAVRIATGGQKTVYRITHIFSASVYLMRISSAAAAHDAGRPKMCLRSHLDELRSTGQAVYGSVRLPPELSCSIEKGSLTEQLIEIEHERIKKLLAKFEFESALGRGMTKSIEKAAKAQNLKEVSLRRLLFRYWYFGAISQGLLKLARGPKVVAPPDKPSSTTPRTPEIARLRPGRRPRTKRSVRRYTKHLTATDVDDMVLAAKRCAKAGIRGYEMLASSYLAHEFKKRHPADYAQYIHDKISAPCTARQIVYRLRKRRDLDAATLQNYPGLRRSAADLALVAVGSGHIYELDATGGQIYIVDSEDPSRVLRAVTIYLLIDRYSRYVVAAYVTLRPPSSAAVRQTLRIALTSRKRRFVDCGIDDEEWPPGVVPLVIVVDNGSDMISKQTLRAAVHDLHIDVDVLPPYTPDGKAIIERLNRTLKAKLAAKGLVGSYKKFRMSPADKAKAKKALVLAIHSLRSFYRELIEIIREYNHSHHGGLEERLPELAQAGLPFTPFAAYKFGLEEVSGLSRPALSDEDIRRLTLNSEKASIKSGVVRRKGKLSYFPTNAAAVAFGQQFGSQSHPISIRVDDTDPSEISAPFTTPEWPTWELDKAGKAFIRQVSLEDWDASADSRASNKAGSKHDEGVRRTKYMEKQAAAKPVRSVRKSIVDGATTRRRSDAESAELDAALNGKAPKKEESQHSSRQERRQQGTDFVHDEAALLEAIAGRNSR